MKQQLQTVSVLTLLVLGALAWLQPALAQDIQFSQYNRTPIQVNPAMAGNTQGKVRLQTAYRNQWSQVLRGDAFNAYLVSADTRVLEDEKQALGLGISGLSDVAGELSFGSRSLNLSASYQRKFGASETAVHKLLVGLEAGIANRRIDLTSARWPSQHDGNGGFDPTIEVPITSVPGINPDFSHADINGGLVWQSIYAGGHSFYLGVAGHHLNKPNVSFFNLVTGEEPEQETSLSIRYTIHGGSEYSLSASWSLISSFLYLNQGEHNSLTLNSSVRKYFGERGAFKFLQGGVSIRTVNGIDGSIQGSALSPIVNLNLKRFNLGLVVDIPINELGDQPIFNGAGELTLGFLFGSFDERNKTPFF